MCWHLFPLLTQYLVRLGCVDDADSLLCVIIVFLHCKHYFIPSYPTNRWPTALFSMPKQLLFSMPQYTSEASTMLQSIIHTRFLCVNADVSAQKTMNMLLTPLVNINTPDALNCPLAPTKVASTDKPHAEIIKAIPILKKWLWKSNVAITRQLNSTRTLHKN